MESAYGLIITVLFSVVRCEHISRNNLYDNLRSIPSKMETKLLSCQPNVTYVQDLNTCVCRSDGKWPKNCSIVFSKFYNRITNKCNPHTYVQVHCNVCKCDSRGVVNYNKCTRHHCETSSRKRKLYSRTATKSVEGTCTPKMWYSYGPCQLCYCVNDTRLVCSTVKSRMGTVSFGKYNFTICGKSFLEDTITTVPNAKKIFRMDDNEEDKEDVQHVESEEIDGEDEVVDEKKNKIEPITNTVKEASSGTDYDDYSDEVDDAKSKAETVTQMPYNDESNRLANLEPKKIDPPVKSEHHAIVKPSFFYPELLDEDDNEPPMGNFLRHNKKFSENKNFIQASVAEVLKKVLDSRKNGFRKMVTLETNGACEPGSKMAVDCNTCFCMRNGKLLCTKKLCLY